MITLDIFEITRHVTDVTAIETEKARQSHGAKHPKNGARTELSITLALALQYTVKSGEA